MLVTDSKPIQFTCVCGSVLMQANDSYMLVIWPFFCECCFSWINVNSLYRNTFFKAIAWLFFLGGVEGALKLCLFIHIFFKKLDCCRKVELRYPFSSKLKKSYIYHMNYTGASLTTISNRNTSGHALRCADNPVYFF